MVKKDTESHRSFSQRRESYGNRKQQMTSSNSARSTGKKAGSAYSVKLSSHSQEKLRSQANIDPSLRGMSYKERRRVYRRRRLVAFVVAIVVLVGVVYGVVHGVGMAWQYLHKEVSVKAESVAVAKADGRLATVPVCTSKDVSFELTPQSLVSAVGAPLNFTFETRYEGKKSCLFDASAQTMALTITSGDPSSTMTTIWKSSACQANAAPKKLLLAEGDVDKRTFTWNGRQSGSQCDDNANFAQAGTYHAQVVIKGKPALHSKKIDFALTNTGA